ncbi:MAG: hypothetical protein JOZ90_10620 [Alphaproteobacteria bacterium]|nr:hypothetical protein [Alphaproteobacteria bacterium]MBV9371088.1 hypothetical protein [Alphaproteobacteria bacterium]MBV9901538.1 hypothetical protein [Alphaproteobacteria bacterium]
MTAAAQAIGSGLGRSLVEALGSDCAAAAALAAHLESGIASIARGTAVCGMSVASVERVARDFANRGWLEARGAGWCRSAAPLPGGLGAFLAGAEAMRVARESDTQALAVVTLPSAPSEIGRALPTQGPIYASIGHTEEALLEIARTAIRSFTVMSPFVNEEGAELVLNLFDQSTAPSRTLITRRAGATRSVLDRLLPETAARGVRVLDYLLRADDGYETFHAKVVVADGDRAYVGSANMTRYARHSMELGVIVTGRSARAVAALVRAVERISHPVAAR